MYAGWEISNKCNLNCKFCYSSMNEQIDELSLDNILLGLTNLKKSGIDTINFCGGEPLLRSNISKIIENAKLIGYETILSTNGLFLNKYIKIIHNNLDWIALPLDSHSELIHDNLRCSGHQKMIINLIKLIHNKFPDIKIKINTMISKVNLSHIIKIGDIIKDYPIKWKLIQFSPRGLGKYHRKKYEISNEQFQKISYKILKNYPKIDIILSSNKERNYSCIIIDPNGDIKIPLNTNYIYFGNVKYIHKNTFNYAEKLGFSKERNHQLYLSSYKMDILK